VRLTPETDKTQKGSPKMALSDQLFKLATRAKELEDRGAAAQQKARADLEKQVSDARESAQAQAERLRKSADETKGGISAWWANVGRSWNDHLDDVRKNVEAKKAAHDAKTAQKAAEQADGDAAYAVDYAIAAVEEAEYAVLDAALAHKEADDLAQGAGA
jgi:hypothetical protein